MSLARSYQTLGLYFTLLCFSMNSLHAHEFWIEPLSFHVDETDIIAADNRVGQVLKGEPYPYAASRFVEFSITDVKGKRTVQGRLGDLPALKLRAERAGLHVAAYQSMASVAKYEAIEKFETFLAEEGLLPVREQHRLRGLPEDGFSEAFTRFGKSLIAVGDGAGSDAPVGFRFELIAETNPYTGDGPMKVRLLYEGEPHGDAQVSIFMRNSEGKVTRNTLKTDKQGCVTIPRERGTMFLVNAVHMVEPSRRLQAEKQVVWHSLWASLTYKTPQ